MEYRDGTFRTDDEVVARARTAGSCRGASDGDGSSNVGETAAREVALNVGLASTVAVCLAVVALFVRELR